MQSLEEPQAKTRLAAAFGVPVVAENPDPPPPAAHRLASARRLARPTPWLAVLFVLLLVLASASVSVLRSRPQELAPVVVTGPSESAAPDMTGDGAATGGLTEVVVHVAGAVATPGVVRLPVGSRVAEAVAAAGGAVPGASLDGLNLARRLNDGEQVVVGVPGPPADGGAVAQPGAPAPTPATAIVGGESAAEAVIDLNTATSEELQELPRIGPATAQKILDFRQDNGRFTSVDQLLDVPGIGERTLEGLRERVKV